MGNMLRFESRRLFKKPSFYVCLALCAAFTLLVIMTSKIGFDSMLDYYRRYTGEFGMSEADLAKDFAEQFSPEMLSLNAVGGYILPIVLAVFTGIFVCEDRVRGTIKNIYARGYSRTSVFFAKFILSTAVAAGIYIVITLTAYLSGILIFATSGLNAEPLHVSGYFLLILGNLLAIMAINTFYFMLSELVGSTGFSIAVNIFAPGFVSSMFSVVLGIMALFGGGEDTYKKYESMMKVLEYWVYNLVYGGFSVDMKTEDYVGHLIACIVYILLFGGLGWLIASKKQVKN